MTRLRADPAFEAMLLRRSRQRYSAQARMKTLTPKGDVTGMKGMEGIKTFLVVIPE
jgi:hypothetical protein